MDVYAAQANLTAAIGSSPTGVPARGAVIQFQRAFNGSQIPMFTGIAPLKVDGIYGPLTQAALGQVIYQRSQAGGSPVAISGERDSAMYSDFGAVSGAPQGDKVIASHVDATSRGASGGDAPTHPTMQAVVNHPAVATAAASHPAVAAVVATHPAVQTLAPHVAVKAAGHVESHGGPDHPAVAVNHPAVKEAMKSHPAVAAVIASHPHVVDHAPRMAERAAAHAERHGWSPFGHRPGAPWYSGWSWGGFGGWHWPWHWGSSQPGAPERHHWWGRLWGWWRNEPEVGYVPPPLPDDNYDPGLPPEGYQDPSYWAVANAGSGDDSTVSDGIDASDDSPDGDSDGSSSSSGND